MLAPEDRSDAESNVGNTGGGPEKKSSLEHTPRIAQEIAGLVVPAPLQEDLFGFQRWTADSFGRVADSATC